MPPLRNSLFALIFGALAALGHAPFGLWWAALIGFSGLIWTATRSTRPGLAVWVGGAGYFGVTLHWIVEPFLVDAATHGWMAPFALVLMAGGLAAFWGLAGWISARLTPGAIGLALWMAASEMARGHVFTGFPWALPAYIWADTPVRLSVAYLGSYGLTLVTLVICALPTGRRAGWPRVGSVSVATLGLAALFAVGALHQGTTHRSDRARVALIQPNVPQDEKWDPDRAPVFARRLIDFTAEAAASDETGHLRMAIWPESAVIWPLDAAGPVFDEVARVADLPLLTGINRRDGDDWFNASVLVDDGAAIETYDKVHLVPFGEYIPFRIDLLRRMAAFTGFGFTPGAGVRAIDTPLGRAVVYICYEAIFPGHVARAGERPELLIQITNDAWFGTFAGPYQHFDQARFRSAEQGLPLIRVANTGVSAMIDAFGTPHAMIPLGEAGWKTAHVGRALPPTPYSRTGDLPVAIVLVLSLGLIAIAKRIRG